MEQEFEKSELETSENFRNEKNDVETHSNLRPYPTFVDILAIVGVFFLASIVVGLLMVFAMKVLDLSKEVSTFLSYTVQMLLVIGFVVIQRRVRGAKGKLIRLSFGSINPPLVLWGVLLIFIVSVVIEPLLAMFPEKYLDLLDNAVGRGGWAILTTVIMAPILEETLFRGYILGSIRQRSGALKAVVYSALVFGLIHVIPQQVVNAFIVGLILGYIYIRTESLAAVILIHVINNGISYLTMITSERNDVTWSSIIHNQTVYWIVYALCCVVFVLSMIKLYVTLRNNSAVDSPNE